MQQFRLAAPDDLCLFNSLVKKWTLIELMQATGSRKGFRFHFLIEFISVDMVLVIHRELEVS
jgi:hypothetical protein